MSKTQRIPTEWLVKLEKTPQSQNNANETANVPANKKEEREAETLSVEEDNECEKAAQNDEVLADAPLPKDTCIIYDDQNTSQKAVYQIVRKLDVGAFGMTYLAKRIPVYDGIPVVIKEFYPQGVARQMKDNKLIINYHNETIKRLFEDFTKEPQRIQSLKKSIEKEYVNSKKAWDKLNLVMPLTEKTFECFGNYYYVMEYVEGYTLRNYLKRKDNFYNLSVEQQLSLLEQLCIAVENLHSVNCIHQDLSPNNVMVYMDKDELRVKVIDYGMSTTLFHTQTHSSFIRPGGTYGFSDTIEQYNTYKALFGNLDKRELVKLIDIYSLGAMLAYVCIMPYTLVNSEYNQWMIRFLKEECKSELEKAELRLQEIQFSHEQQECRILIMILQLIKDATCPILEKRIQKVAEFRNRLIAIREILTNSPTVENTVGTENGSIIAPPLADTHPFTPQNTSIKSNAHQLDSKVKESLSDNYIGINNTTDKPQTVTEIKEKKKKAIPWKKKGTTIISVIAAILITVILVKVSWKNENKTDIVTKKTNIVQTKPNILPEETTDGLSKASASEQGLDHLESLQPETLTNIMAKAQKDAQMKRNLFDKLSKSIVITEIGNEGTAITVSLRQLFNNVNDKYIIGKTHKVDSFIYENGSIQMINLIKIN